MIETVLVGFGGALGAMCRHGLNRLFEGRRTIYPLATQLINLTGALLLGIFAGAQLDQQAYLFLGTGMMGGYTTFSTFNFELLKLYRTKRDYFYRYFILSYVGGLSVGFLGILIGSLI
ncbi:fluoride efflux transporter FluC [Enterococcus mediterraneensis]|uniref:fluoride efflux transporter FluC n=1 Tax=Enterococcus mediterraneensis TaxID=2364791 RepID=UPI0019D01310|nr:CrcB family protein [Enterococcus mediterraneensis]